MEDKISKGGNYKTFKMRSKREHGNFVHPPFKISGSAPARKLYFLQLSSELIPVKEVLAVTRLVLI